MQRVERRQGVINNGARARQQERYHADDERSQAHRQADLERRQRAMQIESAPDVNYMDAYRLELTRFIAMFLNDWEGCPLRLCQRMQGCMAPQSTCANHADDPPMTREEWDVARIEVSRAIDAEIEARGGLDAVEAAAEEEEAAARVSHRSADQSQQKS